MVGSGDSTFSCIFSFQVQLSPFLSLLNFSGVGAWYLQNSIYSSCVVLYQQQTVPSCEIAIPYLAPYSIVQYRFLTMFLERNLYSQPAVQILRRKFAFLSDFISSTIFFTFERISFIVALINAFLGLYPTCIWGSISKPCLS